MTGTLTVKQNYGKTIVDAPLKEYKEIDAFRLPGNSGVIFKPPAGDSSCRTISANNNITYSCLEGMIKIRTGIF